MAASIGDLIDDGVDILSVTRDNNGGTNSITVQLGDVHSEQAFQHNARWMQQVGFCSLPSKPSPGAAAAQACVVNASSNSTCIASADLRGQGLYANLSEGETCVYAGGVDGNAQGRLICKADGSVTRYTTSNNLATGGSGIYDRLGPDGWRLETP